MKERKKKTNLKLKGNWNATDATHLSPRILLLLGVLPSCLLVSWRNNFTRKRKKKVEEQKNSMNRKIISHDSQISNAAKSSICLMRSASSSTHCLIFLSSDPEYRESFQTTKLVTSRECPSNFLHTHALVIPLFDGVVVRPRIQGIAPDD